MARDGQCYKGGKTGCAVQPESSCQGSFKQVPAPNPSPEMDLKVIWSNIDPRYETMKLFGSTLVLPLVPPDDSAYWKRKLALSLTRDSLAADSSISWVTKAYALAKRFQSQVPNAMYEASVSAIEFYDQAAITHDYSLATGYYDGDMEPVTVSDLKAPEHSVSSTTQVWQHPQASKCASKGLGLRHSQSATDLLAMVAEATKARLQDQVTPPYKTEQLKPRSQATKASPAVRIAQEQPSANALQALKELRSLLADSFEEHQRNFGSNVGRKLGRGSSDGKQVCYLEPQDSAVKNFFTSLSKDPLENCVEKKKSQDYLHVPSLTQDGDQESNDPEPQGNLVQNKSSRESVGTQPQSPTCVDHVDNRTRNQDPSEPISKLRYLSLNVTIQPKRIPKPRNGISPEPMMAEPRSIQALLKLPLNAKETGLHSICTLERLREPKLLIYAMAESQDLPVTLGKDKEGTFDIMSYVQEYQEARYECIFASIYAILLRDYVGQEPTIEFIGAKLRYCQQATFCEGKFRVKSVSEQRKDFMGIVQMLDPTKNIPFNLTVTAYNNLSRTVVEQLDMFGYRPPVQRGTNEEQMANLSLLYELALQLERRLEEVKTWIKVQAAKPKLGSMSKTHMTHFR